MQSKIKIQKLKVNCILGVYAEERKKPQDIFVDVEIETDFSKSYGDSNTKNTIDWNTLSEEIIDKLIAEKYFLAETACIELAKWILEMPLAKSVKISIFKKRGLFDHMDGFEAQIEMKK